MDNLALEIGQWALRLPEKPAILDSRYCLTYLQLDTMSRNLAANLAAAGLGKDDYLFVCVSNCVEFAVIYYAAQLLHLPLVSVNPQFRQTEIRSAIDALHPKMGFVRGSETAQQVTQAAPKLPLLQADLQDPQFRRMVTAAEKPLPAVSRDPADICVAVYTSGSSGSPKYVARSYGAQLALARCKIERMHQTDEDILLVALPLCQSFGQVSMQMGGCCGCTVVLMEKFRADAALDLIEKYRVTLQFGVPTMFIREQKAYERREQKPDLSSLRTGIVSGSVAESGVLAWFEDHFGCRLLNNYGMTETGTLTVPDLHAPRCQRLMTCGTAVDGVELEIRDEAGTAVPVGAIGEVFCRTDSIMSGYIGHPSRMDAGWFATGDLGRLDENGCLTIVGRKKDVMIRGGFNVLPAEVEQVYRLHEAVQEVCVVGYADSELGERICAAIRLREGASVTDEALRSFGMDHLARYKLPDVFLRMEKLPRLDTEKYNRQQILESLKNAENNSAEITN